MILKPVNLDSCTINFDSMMYVCSNYIMMSQHNRKVASYEQRDANTKSSRWTVSSRLRLLRCIRGLRLNFCVFLCRTLEQANLCMQRTLQLDRELVAIEEEATKNKAALRITFAIRVYIIKKHTVYDN